MKRTPNPPSPETYADFLALAHSAFESHRRHEHVPASNYPHKVGDRVQYGRHPEGVVEEILEEGRVLHISTPDRGEKQGKPFDNNRRLPRILWWLDVDPIAPSMETVFAKPRVHVQFYQNDLGSVLHRAYSRGLYTSPEYQRDYVWTLEDKQQLIRSVFHQTDIGKLVFLTKDNDYRLEVIDGKQRLNALMEFREGRFAYEGRTWFQLSQQDKHSFLSLIMQSADLDAARFKKSDILWLFLTINTGGVPQTEDHVRKATELYTQALREEGSE